MNTHSKLSAFFGVPVAAPGSANSSHEPTTIGMSKLGEFFGTPIFKASNKANSDFNSPGTSVQQIKSNTLPQEDSSSNTIPDNTEHKAAGIDTEAIFQQKVLSRRIEKNAVRRDAPSHVSKKKVKKFRNRSSEAELKKKYTSQEYLALLISCNRLHAFDSGIEPVCQTTCEHHCQEHFRKEIELLREDLNKWWGPQSSKSSRSDLLHSEILLGYDKQKSTQKWFVCGKQVCINFYCRARGFARTTVQKLSRDVINEKVSFLNSVERNARVAAKKPNAPLRDQISAWLPIFSKNVGDQMPDEDVTVLPYRNLNAVFEEYCDDMTLIGEPTASESHFNNVFNACSNEQKVRMCRDTGTFVTCTACDAYHSRLRSAKTPLERQQLKELRRRHLEKQRIQRQKYYKHKLKAMMHPEKYLSIIIDGMDQKKTDCPVLSRYTKDEAPLGQRIIGVKVHGICNYCYIVDESVPGGSNLTIEILNRVLLDLDSKGMLPSDPQSVLFLQVDNCGENKNRSMFGYLTHLVKENIFWKVKVGFLMVGHTHEDIDQFFSVISKHLKKMHIVCPDQQSLLKEIPRAFDKDKDKPIVCILAATDLLDYVKYYDDFIDPEISYHQEPHQYRIKTFQAQQGNLVVLVHYKMWCHSKNWLPKSDTPESEATKVRTEPEAGQNLAISVPKRKMSRYQVTTGQLKSEVRARINTPTINTVLEDIPENVQYDSDNSAGVFSLQPGNSCVTVNSLITKGSVHGIAWLSCNPPRDKVPFHFFDSATAEKHFKRAQKIYSVICSSFAPKYPNIFDQSVMANWQSWLLLQQQIWGPDVRSFWTDVLLTSLPFPRSISTRAIILDNTPKDICIEDSAFDDLPDEQEFVTHSSGEFGSFTKKQRLEMIRLTLADIESWQKDATIVENMFCIYKFTHEDRVSKEEKTQIAVGLIEKIHSDAMTGEKLFDLRFCPPKGARPASKNRADTLYQDISADYAYNIRYKSAKGNKVEQEDRNLSRSVMLAFNLEINKSDGKFSKKRRADSPYNLSSYSLAENVITSFYCQKPSEL